MKLTYVFHSCFIIEGISADIIIDFYRDAQQSPVKLLLESKSKPLYVLGSHVHSDHFNPEILKWSSSQKEIHYIFSEDIKAECKSKELQINWLNKGDTFKDDRLTVKAFGSTDAGISFYLEFENKKIFHAGDLNNWHWNEVSTPTEIKEAEDYYIRELNDVAQVVQHPDLAMFPVDPRLGKDYWKGALQFIDAVHPHLLAPMHFGDAIKKVSKMQGAVNWEHENESITF
jgi:L-ascorbate metabolism protein UlaG (beta-lactamase superfamily)